MNRRHFYRRTSSLSARNRDELRRSAESTSPLSDSNDASPISPPSPADSSRDMDLKYCKMMVKGDPVLSALREKVLRDLEDEHVTPQADFDAMVAEMLDKDADTANKSRYGLAEMLSYFVALKRSSSHSPMHPSPRSCLSPKGESPVSPMSAMAFLKSLEPKVLARPGTPPTQMHELEEEDSHMPKHYRYLPCEHPQSPGHGVILPEADQVAPSPSAHEARCKIKEPKLQRAWDSCNQKIQELQAELDSIQAAGPGLCC